MLRPRVKFYLAPALGLGFILIFIAVFGRYFPFGDSSIFPFLLFGAFAIVLAREKQPGIALRHAVIVGCFGILACGGLLAPLLIFGGFNPYNDAFTYLAHGDWLQLHAFNDIIPEKDVTPVTTQIAIYQQLGFRMGGSYLLGFFQSILNLQWSYETYPAVVAAPVASAALACGFPLTRQLKGFSRFVRLIILSLTASSLGGIVFGASYGFLAQTFGLMFAAVTLFVYGALLPIIGNPAIPLARKMPSILPVAIMLSASVFCYSELSPFLLLAGALATVVFIVRYRSFFPYLSYAILTAALMAILLNVEMTRAITALLIQKSATVGGPVDWTPMAYLGHALGVHGGAWDMLQWGRRQAGFGEFVMGSALTMAIVVFFIYNIGNLWKPIITNGLLPSAILLGIFALGFLYYRYAAANPFPVGVGQSWSQFKLADWSQPFAGVLILAAIIPTLSRRKLFRRCLVSCVTLAAIVSTLLGIQRSQSILRDYPGVTDLLAYYTSLRTKVFETCEDAPATYLDLAGADYKLRQIVAIFLADRHLKADWTGDGYIENVLSKKQVKQILAKGDCLIDRPAGDPKTFSTPLSVSVYQALPELHIEKIDNVYSEETDSQHRWLWVDHEVRFTVAQRGRPFGALTASVQFTVGAAEPQNMILTVTRDDGQEQKIPIKIISGMQDLAVLLEVPDHVIQVALTSDAKSYRISPNEDRIATFRLLDLKIVTLDASAPR